MNNTLAYKFATFSTFMSVDIVVNSVTILKTQINLLKNLIVLYNFVENF